MTIALPHSGNTPSQTEVKVISCIPIDVTDLQNRIVDLERELDAAIGRPPDQLAAIGAPVYTPGPLFNADPQTPIPDRYSSVNAEPPSLASLSKEEFEQSRLPDPEKGNLNGSDSMSNYNTKNKPKIPVKKEKKKRGKTQMVYFSQTMYPKKVYEEALRKSKRCKSHYQEPLSRKYLTDMVQRQYMPDLIDAEATTSSRFSWPVCRDEAGGTPPHDSDICSCCHGLFRDLDTAHYRERAMRHDYSVYYDSSLYDVVPVKEKSSTFVTDNIYQKRPHDVYLEMEDDYFLKPMKPRVQFQQNDIKCCMVKAPYRTSTIVRGRKKYPTKAAIKKEQVIRSMQNHKQDRKIVKQPSNSVSVECGTVYAKPYYPNSRVVVSDSQTILQSPSPTTPAPLLKNAECLTMNQDTKEVSTNRSVQLEPHPPEDNKTEITLSQIKSILHAVLTEVKTNTRTKHTVPENKSTKDAVVQNSPLPSDIAADSSYMNSYLYSPHYSFGPYGPSFSGQVAGNQTFHHTRSPILPERVFGAEFGTPAFGTPPGQSPCADAAKCIQNYPLFIQTRGRPCACCYRSVPQHIQRVASAVPTQNNNIEVDKKQTHNKETNNLIKEIYQSLAINTKYPHKDGSSHYSSLSTNESNKIELIIPPKAKLKTVTSEIFPSGKKGSVLVKTPAFESSSQSYRSEIKSKAATSSLDTDSATGHGDGGGGARTLVSANRKLVSTSSDTPVEHERRTPAKRERNYARQRNSEYVTNKHGDGSSPPSKRTREYAPPKEKYTVPAIPSSSDEDTMTQSTEETEPSEATVVTAEKKQKKGLFSKMKSLFMGRRQRRKRKDHSSSSDERNEEDLASDSDDYETIYSENTTHKWKTAKHRPVTPPHVTRRRYPRSKVSFPRHHGRDPASPRSSRYRQASPAMSPRMRRSPYMEQEYRRHWTEDLAYHEDISPRYSSEQPARAHQRRPSPRPPYWSQYEARSALTSPRAYPRASPYIKQGGQTEPTIAGVAASPQTFKHSGLYHPGYKATGLYPPGYKATGLYPSGYKATGLYPPGYKATGLYPPGYKATGLKPLSFRPSGFYPPGYKGTGLKPPSFKPSGLYPPGYKATGLKPPSFRPSAFYPPGYKATVPKPSGLYPPGYKATSLKPPGFEPTGLKPPGFKPTGLSYKPALALAYKPAATGLAWFKKLNEGFPQCGVRWKNFFLDG